MSTLQAIILGIVQGLTEFLPVSSSAHLVLVPWWLGWDSPGLAFDTVLHLGTLLAVTLFFWRDWWDMIQAVLRRLRGQPDPEGRDRLFLALVVGTLPAAVLGYLLADFFEKMFRSQAAVALFLIITGFVLALGERWVRGKLPLARIRLSDALIIGIAQAIAILPGISRSGSTITAGLIQGLDRPSAARFSFLLSTPIILGAGIFQLKDMADAGFAGVGVGAVLIGFLAAALSGFIAIRFLIRYLQRRSLYVFSIYVWFFGLATLVRILVRMLLV